MRPPGIRSTATSTPSGIDLGFTDIFTLATNVISTTIFDAGLLVFRTPTPTRTPTPINVGNFVWDDLDGDGRQDAGEPGLAGITVQLWNSTKTQLLGTAVTNASGIYTLIAPTPGDYRVRVVLPSAGDQFSPKDNAAAGDTLDSDVNPSGIDLGFTDIFTLATNVISTTIFDAGLLVFRTPTPTRTPTPINVGNFVWHDLNADGRQDAGEPGLAGVTVQLWNSTKTQLLGTAVTNASGIYTLIAPTPGDYRVRVVLPSAGDQFSPKDNAAAGDTLDSDVNPSGIDLGFTDIFTLATNLISITIIDAGLKNVSPTRTPTATATRTQTPTPSQHAHTPVCPGPDCLFAADSPLAHVGVGHLWDVMPAGAGVATAIPSGSAQETSILPEAGKRHRRCSQFDLGAQTQGAVLRQGGDAIHDPCRGQPDALPILQATRHRHRPAGGNEVRAADIPAHVLRHPIDLRVPEDDPRGIEADAHRDHRRAGGQRQARDPGVGRINTRRDRVDRAGSARLRGRCPPSARHEATGSPHPTQPCRCRSPQAHGRPPAGKLPIPAA